MKLYNIHAKSLLTTGSTHKNKDKIEPKMGKMYSNLI